ncbi:MAG: NADH-quinone oxidoreductase subunit M, partial [Rhodocyclaceae bacterium]|nr:NADH-quinone oxidoreductase subunit M [Rhodocyclaceae bacterium]
MSSALSISLLTLLPVLGGLLILALGEKGLRARTFAVVFGGAALVFAAALWAAFEPSRAGYQFVERAPWIPSLSVDYYVGVDGLGMMLLLLTALLVLMAVAASPGQVTRPKLYYALVLFLQAGLFGTFTALNFFHWFLFWELSLVPAFFLVRLWGGAGRVEAATQFFIYTMVGSVALLLGFVAVYLVTGRFNF